MLDYEDYQGYESYGSSPEEVEMELARKTLIRMFPDIDEEEFIELEEGQWMKFTVDRVLETMLHSVGPAFSMQREFPNEVFYKAREEAYDKMLWVNDENEDAPMPASLIYKAPDIDTDITEDEEGNIIVSKPVEVEKTRKTRGPSPNSKYQKAYNIVHESIGFGEARSHSVTKIMEQLGLPKNTAESYYSKIKAEIEKNKSIR